MEQIIVKLGFLLVLCLGLFAGYFIAKNTKEELKKGKKYFRLLQYILLSTIAGTILWQYSKVIAIIIAVIIFLLQLRLKSKLNTKITIPTLAVLGLLKPEIQAQIFLYALPTASYLYPKKPIKEAGLLLVFGIVVIILQTIF